MMISKEGERLGLLEDVYFLEEVGTIVGYELSDGFFSDIMEGKRVIKTGSTACDWEGCHHSRCKITVRCLSC